MKLTWLGHASFLLEEAGYRMVLDPYTEVPGYPPLAVTAHEVRCSHHHFDHDYVQAVDLLPRKESPFTVRTVETFHDEQYGALRGGNTVHIFTAGGVSVAHLGDLGHPLTAQQLREIGEVDGILIPVGGVYTLDAAGAKEVCDQLHPRWVVPMHYHHAPYGLQEVAEVEPFLSLWKPEEVQRLAGPSFFVDSETKGILVPRLEG